MPSTTQAYSVRPTMRRILVPFQVRHRSQECPVHTQGYVPSSCPKSYTAHHCKFSHAHRVEGAFAIPVVTCARGISPRLLDSSIHKIACLCGARPCIHSPSACATFWLESMNFHAATSASRVLPLLFLGGNLARWVPDQAWKPHHYPLQASYQALPDDLLSSNEATSSASKISVHGL